MKKFEDIVKSYEPREITVKSESYVAAEKSWFGLVVDRYEKETIVDVTIQHIFKVEHTDENRKIVVGWHDEVLQAWKYGMDCDYKQDVKVGEATLIGSFPSSIYIGDDEIEVELSVDWVKQNDRRRI